MKHIFQFTVGYLGYFLIGFMALRALLTQDDMAGSISLFVGLTLLVSYVHYLERKQEKPKNSGYIKGIVMILFLISGIILFF